MISENIYENVYDDISYQALGNICKPIEDKFQAVHVYGRGLNI